MIKNVRRFDVGTISAAQKTAQGFLRAPASATKIGVFKYKNPNGSIRREYRPPEEVFKQTSLDTLAGIPLTNKHPAELLNPSNVTDHQVGYTGDTVQPEGAFVMTNVTIVDGATIKEVESGVKRELSCGYTCELEDSPGIFEGEPYDCIQRNIIYNHLAIVGKGRAGPAARLHLDSQDAIMVTNPESEGGSMEKVNMGGVDHEMHPDAAKAVKDMMAKHDADMKAAGDKYADVAGKFSGMQKAHDDMKEKYDKMMKDAEDLKNQQSAHAAGKETSGEEAQKNEAEREKAFQTVSAKKDALEEEVKALRAKSTPDEKTIRSLVKERTKLEGAAKAVGIKKFDDMSDMEIKKAVIMAKSPKADLTGKADAYVDARFDSVCESLQGSAVSAVTAALMSPPAPKNGSSTHMDTEVPNSDEIRKKRQDEDLAAWQKPIGKTRDEVMARKRGPANH